MIGAGAGLSTAAGFVYSGERFTRYFGDFSEKYGFQDMYSGPARAKALNLLKKDVRQFDSRDIHQKVEVLHIKVMEADSRKSFVKIEGQLLRSTQIDGQCDSSVVRFEIAMSMNALP